MDERKIVTIILAIAGILALAGVIIWLFIRPQPSQVTTTPTPTPMPTQPANGGGGSSQTITPTSPAPSIPDIAQEYRELFSQLGAKTVSFSRNSGEGELSEVYALYTADIEQYKALFPNQKDLSISIASLDLDSDGVSEAIVLEDLPGYCGTAGCALQVFAKVNGEWKSILDILAEGAVGVSGAVTNGFFNLFITTHGELGYQSEVVEYGWISGQYQPLGIVAQWDGSTFQLVR